MEATTEKLSTKQVVRRAGTTGKNITKVQSDINTARQALNTLRHIALYDAGNVIEMDLVRTLMAQFDKADEALNDQYDGVMKDLYSQLY